MAFSNLHSTNTTVALSTSVHTVVTPRLPVLLLPRKPLPSHQPRALATLSPHGYQPPKGDRTAIALESARGRLQNILMPVGFDNEHEARG